MTRLAEQALAENNCARDPRWNRALAVGRERSVRQPQEEMGTAAGSNEEITQHEGAYRQSVLRKHRSVIPMSGEMDEFSQRLSGPFGARLAENFQKQACYYNAMDFQEYVAEDTATVAECEDSLLTLFVAADVHRRVVYRMKGFRYVFNLSARLCTSANRQTNSLGVIYNFILNSMSRGDSNRFPVMVPGRKCCDEAVKQDISSD